MLTRAVFLTAGWFAISLAGLLLGGTRLRRGGAALSLGWLVAVLLLGDLWAFLTFGVPLEMAALTALALAFGVVWSRLLPDWNAFGQVAWTMSVLATLFFIVYAFMVTAFSPLNPISFLLAMTFLLIEAVALLLALSHTYESLDVTSRIRWRRQVEAFPPVPGYTPKVSLQVPAHNEPPEVVAHTLRSLANMDYPNFEVLVIDNNTPEENDWRPLAEICRDLGPRFRFLHLEDWPGYKSGALNFALTQTAPDAEIIAVVDADYELEPNFLRETVAAFADPQVAFVQTPQDYRGYEDSAYSEAIYFGYKYFFEVSMPSRNEHNAIIFAGTTGLLRKTVLQEIGGWDEWTITEDAELSLRILKRGYKSLYYKKTFGHGLMPFSFDGLKKQRFRWCFGGMQILRKHWEALMPWSHWVDPENRLTMAQRYYYLVGGLQWFTDVFNLLFAAFLVLGALFSVWGGPFVIRPLTGPLMIMPAVFLLLNLWRFVWVLRKVLNLSWQTAVRTMYGYFSLGWAVALATFQGLVRREGVFLRTPKSQSRSAAVRALRVTTWETAIGLTCLVAGLAAVVAHPRPTTVFLATLLLWQASLYLAAPTYSLLSARASGAAAAGADDEYTAGEVWESRAARWAVGAVAVLLVIGALLQFLPQPQTAPSYSRYQPVRVPAGQLFGFNPVPLSERAFTPTPTPPTPTSPAATATPPVGAAATATATAGATTDPSASPSPTAQTTGSPTATDTATPEGTATAAATPGASPSASPTADPSATGTTAPTATPPATATPNSTATSPATATPNPTATSTPAATPTPQPTQPTEPPPTPADGPSPTPTLP
jgi:cellulose synthase/poly-beta-1,6-N-acetylglucosamine synthase-like glycosyltransferase